MLLALLLVGAAVQAAIALTLARSSWFGVDAVSYLTTRGPVPQADEGLLRPYGGHWQTIPLLLYRGLFAAFGMRSYRPYVAVALLLHLVIVLVVFALLRSVGAHVRTAAIASWLVLFFGAGAEAFMWDAPMVLTSALLLGLVAALVLVRSEFSLRSTIVAAVLLLASVMCSGTGLVAAVTVGCFVLLRAGVRAAVLVSAPALLAFSVWYFTIGRDGRVHVSGDRVPEVPGFVWSGLTGAAGSVLGVPGTSAVVLLGLLAVVLWSGPGPAALRQLAVAGAVGAVTQLVLSSFASLVDGDQAARVGRYEYLVLVLLSASVALAWETVERVAARGGLGALGQRMLPAATVVLLAVATIHGISGMREQADFGAASARLYKTWVYGSVMAADAGEKQLVQDASNGFNGGRFELFAEPELRAALPAGPATPQTRLDAESEYFVDVSDRDPGLFSPTRIRVEGLRGLGTDQAGCHDLVTDGTTRPLIEVATRRGTEIGITSTSTVVATQLVRNGISSAPRTWFVPPGPVYVATTARHATLRIALDAAGSVAVCHR